MDSQRRDRSPVIGLSGGVKKKSVLLRKVGYGEDRRTASENRDVLFHKTSREGSSLILKEKWSDCNFGIHAGREQVQVVDIAAWSAIYFRHG
jgi:hypothetical protein